MDCLKIIMSIHKTRCSLYSCILCLFSAWLLRSWLKFPLMEFPFIPYLQSNQLAGKLIYFLSMKLPFLPLALGYLFQHLSCWRHSESVYGTAMPRETEQSWWRHVFCQLVTCLTEREICFLLTVFRVWPKTETCWVYWCKLLHNSWILSFSSSSML